MIKRVLVANRGAIAVRIIRTLREMNIESVAVYAEVDRESLHVRMADRAVSLGDGAAAQTYLDQQKIIGIALQTNTHAIHPGYGFLSENTDFVRQCESNQLVFLGPTPEQIEAFGLKHKARELAKKNRVPLLPGSLVLTDVQEALVEAKRIAYPVMLKSTAGGGGIGMQLCLNEEELAGAWDGVSTLSANNFSNADLFIEKFVSNARHIEVQIFGDGQGDAISIGERDCSAQRRNQKVLEETPAPNISAKAREQLHGVAVELAKAVNYRSAGTVEFIFDADTENFYFLEVNARLQVEHGVTEEVYSVDIVRWMIELARNDLAPLVDIKKTLVAKGHAIQARIYAEDPARNFQPSSGLLSHVRLPEESENIRIDHWIEAGIVVSPYFDPMLAKVIAIGANRESALHRLRDALRQFEIYGIESNIKYLVGLLEYAPIVEGRYLTQTLSNFKSKYNSIEVISPGTLTTIQDYPGRTGYWNIGVPPSGPFDSFSFRLGNSLLGNDERAAGLEMTLNGAQLRFTDNTAIVLTGANAEISVNNLPVVPWTVCQIKAGQILRVGNIGKAGVRAYLLVAGGIQCPEYLGSRATFTLGKFGGHVGRALRTGDILHLDADAQATAIERIGASIEELARPEISHSCEIRVIAGPQGAPDYFSPGYIETFFNTAWEVHFNSSRTGVRLIGPKPEWARSDGGEAGMHPSNIHDNAYAIGAIDFTGDMPVILGPDGPSLGGFVCPASVISADLWKVGQLTAGDTVRFVPVDTESAVKQLECNNAAIASKRIAAPVTITSSTAINTLYVSANAATDITVRQSGDSFLLVEYGPHVLDIELRFLVHRLMLSLQAQSINGVLELTPGIRSLQVHYDCRVISYTRLIDRIQSLAIEIAGDTNSRVKSRIIHLPLSWDDEQCGLAIEKYQQVVRKDAPWYPSNIEFIRRINGLKNIEEVKKIVFGANYLVMGLGDVYLGAPVATPVDPRHRLVTTKYNPARTWTAENSVGIGGSYMCIYGMEGPGGYQFVGRTLQMWNRYRKTLEFDQPWLLRVFDQVRFYPVSSHELLQIRKDFPLGQYPLKIENTEFDLNLYKQFLQDNERSISEFVQHREKAFDQELEHWKQTGQLHFEQTAPDPVTEESEVPLGMTSIDSPVAGSVWQLKVKEGETIKEGQCIMILESMKMEVDITATMPGVIRGILKPPGSNIAAGAALVIVETESSLK